MLAPGGRLLILERKLKKGTGHGLDRAGADRLAQMLTGHGYNTAEVGTMHLLGILQVIWGAMGLLLGIYIINFLDRQVVNILAEPIKRDLGLADWQLGLMSGLAFALFYTFLGIPIARLAERKNRAVIIGSAVAVWSGFTALCATAGNFWQLVLYRIGVGVGEAGCTPPAHSLIVDYVPKAKRSSGAINKRDSWPFVPPECVIKR